MSSGNTSTTTTPLDELEARWSRCRAHLARHVPGAGGLMAFSRLNLFWLSGTLASGVFWLPLDGPPVLLCRKGLERARLESPLGAILPFRSYRDLPVLLAEAGAPLADTVGVEMNGLSWALGQVLAGHLPTVRFLSADGALARARAVKTERELAVIRRAGELHRVCMEERLPPLLRPGLTERDIAHRIWEVFFAAGHQGLLRLEKFGEEVFLGHVAAGEHANYPSVYNGPVGLRGEHPGIPYMGHAATAWKPGQPVTCDVGFSLEGYTTDKTQVYWAGTPSSVPARVAAAHRLCFDIEARLAALLRPGAVPSELAAMSFQWADKAGWGEGFMGLGGNKVAFLGHGIGLAIDEWPVLAKGFDDPLEEGMVLALEPKIGIPGLGMVGVEDTFEVTAAGGRSLTGGLPEMLCIP